MTTANFSRQPRASIASRQDNMPSHYSLGVRIFSMAAFVYVVFAFLNARMLHWFEGADGQAPLWLSQWTEYVVILGFGIWRTIAEQNPYTRKRLGALTASLAIFWWLIPNYLRLPEPYIGAVPGQPIFPQLHAPGTITFFAVLLLVLLFGRRIICGWNCPCVGIRETVGFAFREKTLRSETAWHWRYTKWFFFALYVAAFILIMTSATAYVSPFYSGFLALVAVTYFGSFFVAPFTGNRFYCRYLCPYGATFGLLNHIGFYGIKMDKAQCVDCQRCEQVCDMGIPVWRQGKEHGQVTGLEDCMGCGRCVLTCPTDALEFRDVRNAFSPNLKMNASHLLKRPTPTLGPRKEPVKRLASQRRNDWQEDHLPMTLDAAITQARRCLDCGVPGCRNACPLDNRIPEWLEALGRGDVMGAADISNATSAMPEICGSVCPQHRLCEGACTLQIKDAPVTIGALERFISQEALKMGWRPNSPHQQSARFTGFSAAVIGAGPAGLACAQELVSAGIAVTVYDKRQEIGGLLTYGIPSFKLNKSAVTKRKLLLEEAGIQFQLGSDVDSILMQHLVEHNDAVFLGTGSQRSRNPSIPGSDLTGVIDGLSYLSDLNSNLLKGGIESGKLDGQRVIVLGGGDTAMDCARSAVRQGAASTTVAYRRGEENMRASPKEIALAREEGVAFAFHRVPITFTGTNALTAVKFAPHDGGAAELQTCDKIVIAFGLEAEKSDWLQPFEIATNRHGFLIIDENGKTSHAKIFAGGDNTHGPDLVVTALAAGRRAGLAIVNAMSLAATPGRDEKLVRHRSPIPQITPTGRENTDLLVQSNEHNPEL